MTGKSTFVDPTVQQYLIDTAVREPLVLRELREETSRLSNAVMQIGPDQGAFMQLLAKLIGAKRYIEAGVFTGYSALAVALALPDDGIVVACDTSEEYTAIAKRYWAKAGVEKKIDLRLAPALESMDALIAQGQAGTFDLAFIDADKTNVDNYYERVLTLLRKGGLMLVDNVLWSGRVVDPSDRDADTAALRAINEKAGKDERVDVALVPVCDGILMARKR